MPDQLSYDPLSKKLIKDTLYQFLYAPVESNFRKRLDALIRQNSKLLGNTQEYLDFQGEIYQTSQATVPEPRQINRCHKDIRPLMKEYVEDLKKMNQQEVPYVVGYINKVLNSSESLVDYFQLLPESVHAPLKKLSCPCTENQLKPDQINRIQQNNQPALAMMKMRLVENLLL